MAANDPGPELDALNKLLVTEKVGSSDDQKKLRDLFVSLLDERNKLKEQIAAVEAQSQANVNRASDASPVCESCVRLRKEVKDLEGTRQYLKGEVEHASLRLAELDELKDKQEKSINQLEQTVALNEQQGRNLDGSSASGASPVCESCVRLRKEVKDLKGTQQHLKGEVEHASLRLVELDELKKKQEKSINQLEQTVALHQQRERRDIQSSGNSWFTQSVGGVYPSQSVGGGNGPNVSHRHSFPSGQQLPVHQQHAQYPSPRAHRSAATFPQGFSLAGYDGNEEEPPLRAQDPLIQSSSQEGIAIDQLGDRYYSSSPQQDFTQSCDPALLRQAQHFMRHTLGERENEFEKSGYFGSALQGNSRRVPFPQSSNPPFQQAMPVPANQQSWARDDQVHHGYPGALPGAGNISPDVSASRADRPTLRAPLDTRDPPYVGPSEPSPVHWNVDTNKGAHSNTGPPFNFSESPNLNRPEPSKKAAKPSPLPRTRVNNSATPAVPEVPPKPKWLHNQAPSSNAMHTVPSQPSQQDVQPFGERSQPSTPPPEQVLYTNVGQNDLNQPRAPPRPPRGTNTRNFHDNLTQGI